MRRAFLGRFGAAATLPIVLALFGCGSSDTTKVEADEWAEDLCDLVLDNQAEVEAAGADWLEAAEAGDTRAAKDEFADFMEEGRDIRDETREDFDDLGEPDIDGGAQVVKIIKDQRKSDDAFLAEAADRVKDIDDDDDFLEEFDKIVEDIPDEDLREKLEDLADEERDVERLLDDIDAEPGCADAMFTS